MRWIHSIRRFLCCDLPPIAVHGIDALAKEVPILMISWLEDCKNCSLFGLVIYIGLQYAGGEYNNYTILSNRCFYSRYINIQVKTILIYKYICGEFRERVTKDCFLKTWNSFNLRIKIAKSDYRKSGQHQIRKVETCVDNGHQE